MKLQFHFLLVAFSSPVAVFAVAFSAAGAGSAPARKNVLCITFEEPKLVLTETAKP